MTATIRPKREDGIGRECSAMQVSRRRAMGVALGGGAALSLGVAGVWDELIEKRVAVVAPGTLYRGAWQRPWPLRRIIGREQIRTIVTLTAINRDDVKYVRQARVGVESRNGAGKKFEWEQSPFALFIRLFPHSAFAQQGNGAVMVDGPVRRIIRRADQGIRQFYRGLVFT